MTKKKEFQCKLAWLGFMAFLWFANVAIFVNNSILNLAATPGPVRLGYPPVSSGLMWFNGAACVLTFLGVWASFKMMKMAHTEFKLEQTDVLISKLNSNPVPMSEKKPKKQPRKYVLFGPRAIDV